MVKMAFNDYRIQRQSLELYLGQFSGSPNRQGVLNKDPIVWLEPRKSKKKKNVKKLANPVGIQNFSPMSARMGPIHT
jgi:hypothetical protein